MCYCTSYKLPIRKGTDLQGKLLALDQTRRFRAANMNPRTQIPEARRIVVKVGTRLLVREDGTPDEANRTALVHQLADLCSTGKEIVLVSSGAVGSGLPSLGFTTRPRQIEQLQMAAAVGQTQLMSDYTTRFAERDLQVGQVLLTHADLQHRARHLNARNTMQALLAHGVIPIVNENDAIAVDEIKVGDNDVLAALVAILVDADLLILLTSAPGLLGPKGRIPHVPKLTDDIRALADGKGSALSTGGMATKLEAAHTAARVGIHAIIADGREADTLGRVCAGEDCGTLIGSGERALRNRRKSWLAFFQRPEGTLHVDAGAERALREGGKSLLPSGIQGVEGAFGIGAVIQVAGPSGAPFAQGLTQFGSADIDKIKGCQSDRIPELLGAQSPSAVIHRDNLVLLSPDPAHPSESL